MNNYTLVVEDKDTLKIIESLKNNGLKEIGVKSEYEQNRFTGDNVTATLYKSGKLLIQGKRSENLFEILSERQVEEFTSHIGSDEVGKGDYFGPLVVASCYVAEKNVSLLKKLRVADSKKISDSKIVEIYNEIRDVVDFEYLIIEPKKYDELINETKNVAILLARAHVKTLTKLVENLENQSNKVNKIVIDQFSKSKQRFLNEADSNLKRYKIEQMHHGESDIAVAAASIIARAIFLNEWNKMEKVYNFSFPKGASDVIGQAQIFVDQFGFEKLKEVAKVSFNTTKSLK